MSTDADPRPFWPAEWEIVFVRERWLLHVLAYGFCERTGVWLVVDPGAGGQSVYPVAPADMPRVLVGLCPYPDAHLVRPARCFEFALPVKLASCATIVAHAIGFRSRALFARTLYRQLAADPETEILRELREKERSRRARGGDDSSDIGGGRRGCAPAGSRG